ncbi:hypothetical protein ACJX0J_023072 [Zea mays]
MGCIGTLAGFKVLFGYYCNKAIKKFYLFPPLNQQEDQIYPLATLYKDYVILLDCIIYLRMTRTQALSIGCLHITEKVIEYLAIKIPSISKHTQDFPMWLFGKVTLLCYFYL